MILVHRIRVTDQLVEIEDIIKPKQKRIDIPKQNKIKINEQKCKFISLWTPEKLFTKYVYWHIDKEAFDCEV